MSIRTAARSLPHRHGSAGYKNHRVAQTVEEQKDLGGEPDKCVVYWYEYYLFESDDNEVQKMREECLAGKLLCGTCKKKLADKLMKFITEHQERREKITKEMIDKLIIKE
ncbi:MAG: hypothetical protein ACFFDW_02110 [Candidatus Thorarchaeota archaeon]